MRFTISMIGLAALATAPAHAQSADAEAARAPFQACGKIADKDARVACFDRALQASEAEPAAPREARHRKNAEFGIAGSPVEKEQLRRAPKPSPQENEVELAVVRATEDGLGHWTIESADGAAWRQVETVATFLPPAKGQRVLVKKGAMGGYMLKVGHQPLTRVERVR